MNVAQVMTHNVECMRPDASLTAASRKMKKLDIGSLPVCGDNDRLIGMITDRDICMAAYTRGRPLSELAASGAMSTRLFTCRQGDTLRSAMDLMSARQVRRVPVVDDDGKLVGIVSLADLARLSQAPTAHSQEARAWLSGVLAGISEPPGAHAQPGSAAPS